MGSFMRVKVWYRDIFSILSKQEVQIYGAVLDGQSMYEMQPPETGILMIGNESKGIREDVQSLINHRITIPRTGQAESLNAAVALGILLSQFKKPH